MASRTTICGYGVAKDYHFGVLLLVSIPAAVLFAAASFIFTPTVASIIGISGTTFEALVLAILCFLACRLLFLLLTCDPGFVTMEPESFISESEQSLVVRCRSCNADVIDFDHHCTVIGACIGRRNMGLFLCFLAAVDALCVYALLTAALALALEPWPSKAEVTLQLKNVVFLRTHFLTYTKVSAAAVIVACIYAGGYCIGLLLVYIFLVWRGKFSVQRRKREAAEAGFHNFSTVFSEMRRIESAHKVLRNVQLIE